LKPQAIPGESSSFEESENWSLFLISCIAPSSP
jgi:hypothetical protein